MYKRPLSSPTEKLTRFRSILLSINLLFNMGNGQSISIRDCLDAVCANRSSCVTYPNDPLFA